MTVDGTTLIVAENLFDLEFYDPEIPGRNLQQILLLTEQEYWDHFERRSFLVAGDRRSVKVARKIASDINHEFYGRPKILLGSRVAEAFGIEFEPFYIWYLKTGNMLLLPALGSTLWRVAGASARAREALRILEGSP